MKGKQKVTEEPEPSLPLRQRQQALSRDAILDAASALFIEQGYRKTTMQAIADRAGVGVATLFRHFKNKAGILAAISQRDMEAVLASCQRILKSQPADPIEGTLAILHTFLKILDMPDSGFRWQSGLWVPVQTGHPEADEVVSWADREVQAMLKKLLMPFKRRGVFDKAVDLDDVVAIIFSVFNQHFLTFATTPSVSKEQMIIDLERRIPLLFKAWLKESA